MSRWARVTYVFADFHFLHFGELEMRFYTALHLAIGCIY